MAFRPSAGARIYVGILSATAYARSASTNASFVTHDTTTLADRSRVFLLGQNTSTFTIAGPLDTDATSNGQYDAITDLQASTAATPITYMPLGTDGAAWLIEAWQTSIDADTSATSTANWAMAAQTTGIADMNGVILSDAAITADTDGSTIDNGAATTNGAVFHLHVTGYTGLTSDVIIVEGSGTGSFGGEETTIATFTTVAGLTSQRLAVTGTVPRYLRVADDVTGTGTCTRIVVASRR